MKRLTKQGQDLRDEFESAYGDTSCSCHSNPPCGYCTHPGNPLCLEESDDLWEEVKDGCELIAEERQRQISQEGWTPEHDDLAHQDQELVWAANAYAYLASGSKLSRALLATGEPPTGWPWERSWWKPSDDPVRNLVKAGALVAAEIDRLQRLAGKEAA